MINICKAFLLCNQNVVKNSELIAMGGQNELFFETQRTRRMQRGVGLCDLSDLSVYVFLLIILGDLRLKVQVVRRDAGRSVR